jgi:hypothetical protein
MADKIRVDALTVDLKFVQEMEKLLNDCLVDIDKINVSEYLEKDKVTIFQPTSSYGNDEKEFRVNKGDLTVGIKRKRDYSLFQYSVGYLNAKTENEHSVCSKYKSCTSWLESVFYKEKSLENQIWTILNQMFKKIEDILRLKKKIVEKTSAEICLAEITPEEEPKRKKKKKRKSKDTT